MKIIPAIDAENRFGQLLDTAQREPVTIAKKGRPAAVVLSVEDYDRIRGAARRRLMATIEQTRKETVAAGMSEEIYLICF